MKNIQLFIFTLFCVCYIQHSIKAQCNPPTSLVQRDEFFSNPAFGIHISIKKDRLDRPFVYVTSKNAGLKIFDISSVNNPTLVATISPTLFGNLDAIQVVQEGQLLYLMILAEHPQLKPQLAHTFARQFL